jgi:hypothetical protein
MAHQWRGVIREYAERLPTLVPEPRSSRFTRAAPR